MVLPTCGICENTVAGVSKSCECCRQIFHRCCDKFLSFLTPESTVVKYCSKCAATSVLVLHNPRSLSCSSKSSVDSSTGVLVPSKSSKRKIEREILFDAPRPALTQVHKRTKRVIPRTTPVSKAAAFLSVPDMGPTNESDRYLTSLLMGMEQRQAAAMNARFDAQALLINKNTELVASHTALLDRHTREIGELRVGRGDSIMVNGLIFSSDVMEEQVNFFIKLFKLLGTTVVAQDFKSIRRVKKSRAIQPSSQQQRTPISNAESYIVSFYPAHYSLMLVDAKKKFGDLLNSVLTNSALDTLKVYINPILPKELYLLLKGAKAAAKAHGIKYVWHREGKIMLRPKEGDKVVTVYSQCELDAFINSFTNTHTIASTNQVTPTYAQIAHCTGSTSLPTGSQNSYAINHPSTFRSQQQINPNSTSGNNLAA